MARLFPSALLEAFAPAEGQSQVVLFLGAGPSTSVGLPGWPDLVMRVAQRLGFGDDVGPAIARGDYLDAVNHLVRCTSEAEVQEVVSTEITSKTATASLRLHRLLLSIPWNGILTTNYDTLLTRADSDARYELPVSWRTSNLRQQFGRKFVVHVHGTASDPETIVLSRRSYDDISLRGGREMRQFLMTVFETRVVLFVGFAFRDQHLDDLLRDMVDVGAIGAESAYALVPSRVRADPTLEGRLRERHVRPILLPARKDRGAAAIAAWLRMSSRAITALETGRLRAVRAARPTAVLSAVREAMLDAASRNLLETALRVLPNRPDLEGWLPSSPIDRSVDWLLDRLSTSEVRSLMSHLWTIEPRPLLEDVLSAFPPESRKAP